MSDIDQQIADGLRDLADMYDRGVFAGRTYPEQGPTISITMPSIASVEEVAASLGVTASVRVRDQGDVHTRAVGFIGPVEVRAVHIQDAEVAS